ncbi:hypothetical protein BDV93DRAFT_552761 [Ceratobasidium sp. AG-I]|nr:hypothetical protein BDV93DRAFT_552761 [Ceratobasidium sp. AG-I]
MKQCSNLDIGYSLNLGTDEAATANPPPTPPYSLILYRGGSQPLVFPVNNKGTHGSFQWVNNLAVGPPYTMSMRDSQGYSGGIVFIFTMVPGSGCNLTDPMKPNTLDVAITGTAQCGQADIVVNNGAAPYKLVIIAANLQPKTLYFATNIFSITLDMAEATQYYIVMNDSLGNSATSGLYGVAGSADASCLERAQTVTAGMFSTLYSGSGVATPTTAVRTTTSTTSIHTSPSSTATSTAQDLNTSHKSAPVLTIALAASVSIAVLLLILLCLLLLQRRRKQRKQAALEKAHSSTQPATPTKPEEIYDPMTMHPHYVSASGAHNNPSQLTTLHENPTAAPTQQQYPTHAVPEIQSEVPRNHMHQQSPSTDWRISQASSVNSNSQNNRLIAPIPRPSSAGTSQPASTRTSSNRSPQDTSLLQNSGQAPQSVPPEPAALSSGALSSPSWLTRGVPPSRTALSPPPRVGTAATGTSSVPPQYAERWEQPQHTSLATHDDKK